MESSTIDIVFDFAAGGGLALGIFNCVLELARSRPRAMVRVRKIADGDGVDVGYSAAVVNTGITAFTVVEAYLLRRTGQKARPRLMPLGKSDKMPKVLHPGEQCKIEVDRVGGENAPVTGDAVRMVFAISSGKEFRSKKLPGGVEPGALVPVPAPPE